MEKHQNLSRYSFIYNELVDGPQDFVGLVAYSVYKQDKIKYVKRFEAEHNRAPTPEELQEFHAIARNSIGNYKEVAESRVNAFFEDIYKEHAESLDLVYQKRLLSELTKSRSSWWSGVFQSVIGSLIFSVFIGVIVICSLYSQYGLGWILQDIIKTMVKP